MADQLMKDFQQWNMGRKAVDTAKRYRRLVANFLQIQMIEHNLQSSIDRIIDWGFINTFNPEIDGGRPRAALKDFREWINQSRKASGISGADDPAGPA
eukprot:5738080-Pyramimonas_sp.AAC.1